MLPRHFTCTTKVDLAQRTIVPDALQRGNFTAWTLHSFVDGWCSNKVKEISDNVLRQLSLAPAYHTATVSCLATLRTPYKTVIEGKLGIHLLLQLLELLLELFLFLFLFLALFTPVNQLVRDTDHFVIYNRMLHYAHIHRTIKVIVASRSRIFHHLSGWVLHRRIYHWLLHLLIVDRLIKIRLRKRR